MVAIPGSVEALRGVDDLLIITGRNAGSVSVTHGFSNWTVFECFGFSILLLDILWEPRRPKTCKLRVLSEVTYQLVGPSNFKGNTRNLQSIALHG